MTRTKGPVTRISVPSDDEYEWLNTIREDLGLTWRGLMLKAEQRLRTTEQTWPAEFQTQTVLVASDAEAEAGKTTARESGTETTVEDEDGELHA
ncbi:hypothetical protein EFA46_015465 (plasmid) [Halarchaeum sp. CBA1220]|uniref:hypothetical protein n=1 Tax=Halarchaeum sp. CBA1220 TaxID=1853682 RepID=UPI000F3A8BB0|nr:hypothetical protein [Halarchaeum sp. CBA1220]QLC35657.1 hypothetical protein EFA46_015465 [Halarchaeum sp. CBA1220]